MLRFLRLRFIPIILAVAAASCGAMYGQTPKSTLDGVVKDISGAVLPGARVDLEPKTLPVVSNGQGEFFIANLAPGSYKVSISYSGFETYTTTVTLTAGQPAHVDAVPLF